MTPRACSTSALLICVTLLGGCSSGPNRVATENDRLRSQAVDLEDQVRALTGRNAELEAQLRLSSKAPGAVSDEVAAATPKLVAISLGRLSHATDDNSDGKFDALVLYLEPSDGLGRFMQIVGSAAMHAVVIPTDAPAQTIGQATLGPKALRDAYRGAFGGPAYTLTLPITPPADAEQCTVRVVFTDAYTGQEFSAERVIDLK